MKWKVRVLSAVGSLWAYRMKTAPYNDRCLPHGFVLDEFANEKRRLWLCPKM